MEEATEYKKYLAALKKATDSVKEDKKKQKGTVKIQLTKFSCGGMGHAIKGGKFEGVR